MKAITISFMYKSPDSALVYTENKGDAFFPYTKAETNAMIVKHIIPGDIIDLMLVKGGHTGIVKQVFADGTLSIYEQNYDNSGLLIKRVSINPYDMWEELRTYDIMFSRF